MTNGPGQALADALALLRAPRSARPGLDQRLPEGIFLLLRLVAGEEQALATAREHFIETPERLREASAFYLQQVLFAPDADCYRVLGVDPDAADEKIREHYRWLARWLHPDRNQDEWEAFYADRVNQAWNCLRTPEKRQRYDAERPLPQAVVHQSAPIERVPIRRHEAEALDAATGWNLRWLPAAVLGSLAVVAVLGVVVFSLLRYAESSQPVAVVDEAQEQPEVPAALQAIEREASMPAVAPAPAPAPAAIEPRANIAPTPAPAPAPAPAAVRKPAEPAALAAATTPAPPRSHERVPAPSKPRAEPRPVDVAVVLPPKSEARPAPPMQASPAPVNAFAVSNVAALPPPEPAPVPDEASGAVSDRTANQILGDFSRAYSDGNLSGMRVMFTHDATGPGGDLSAIMSNYREVFGSSSERSLNVSNVSWWTTGPTLTIVASYVASVSGSRNAAPRRTHGDLRLDLRKQGDQWRIFRLRHDERPG